MLSGLYVYWFVADNQLTPYHGERMWWMARDLIRTGVLQRWAYVSYFTACLARAGRSHVQPAQGAHRGVRSRIPIGRRSGLSAGIDRGCAPRAGGQAT